MADNRGISSFFYMQKIISEEGERGKSDRQMRLNPIMKEVVQKEVIKWLDTRIIYPSDSS